VSVADFELLRAHLQFVELKQKAALVRTGEPLTRIYFPHDGIISLVVRFLNGNTIEAAMIGRDSVFGTSAALGIALNDAIVQLPAEGSVPFRTTLIRHEQALLAQALQSDACSASQYGRVALVRWLFQRSLRQR
jgi:CRP-like cAMP-binding protein